MRLPTLYHVVVIPGAALSAFLALGFLRYTSLIETQELRFRLNSLAVRTEWADASDLLIRLQAEQKLNAVPDQKAGEDEIKLLAAFTERKLIDESGLTGESPMARLYRSLIIALQRLAGIRPAQHVYLETGPDVLTLAYNLERRRLFSAALLTFQQGLNRETMPATREFILLHSGYCMFFLADYDAAEKFWRQVETSSRAPVNAVLATRLLSWLREFRLSKAAAAGQRDGKTRALQYYRILAYKESLESLLRVREPERDAAYYLLRGRVKEAPGNFAEAADDYTAVLSARPPAPAGVVANRRLYAMGAHYRPNEKLAQAATTKAAGLGDAAFFQSVAAYAPALETPVPGKDYASEKAYRQLMAATGEKILQKTDAVRPKVRTIRIKTRNGSVITGREIRSSAALTVVENENGRFRIPAADIETKEIVSGN